MSELTAIVKEYVGEIEKIAGVTFEEQQKLQIVDVLMHAAQEISMGVLDATEKQLATGSGYDIQKKADRLISTLDSLMSSEKADAIVRDVAEELYQDVLGIDGKIVVDKSQPMGHFHAGRQMHPIVKFKFEPVKEGRNAGTTKGS